MAEVIDRKDTTSMRTVDMYEEKDFAAVSFIQRPINTN